MKSILIEDKILLWVDECLDVSVILSLVNA